MKVDALDAGLIVDDLMAGKGLHKRLAADRGVRLYAACLALANVVTAIFWLTRQSFSEIVGRNAPAICWPMLPECEFWRWLTPEGCTTVLMILAGASVVNCILFCSGSYTRTAIVMLVALSMSRFGMVLLDYRLMMNQHYMAFWIFADFILSPAPRRSIPVLIVLFYFWAGLLKLQPDWLSGAALLGTRPFSLPPMLIPLACAYVVLLELVVAWGLLAKQRVLFWPAFAQIILFHISSWWVVGFFYPVLMFLILAALPLFRSVHGSTAPVVTEYGRLRSGAYVAVMAVGFSVCQLIPKAIAGDEAITGEGRLIALNMFDAPKHCVATVFEDRQGKRSESLIKVPFMEPRLACDPIVYFDVARRRCRGAEGGVREDFGLRLITRRASWSGPQTVVEIKNFCSQRLSYSIFRHNPWIRAVAEAP
jgi:hypothetical protein